MVRVGGGDRGRDRGQAELVSLVLLVAVTIIGITIVLAIGSTALTDTQRLSEINSAEHAMTQFDSRTSLVALGASSRQETTIPLQGRNARLAVDPDEGRMNVSIINGSDTDVLFDRALGTVTYENEQTTIAYQGGGVWKQTGTGSTMISPPEFHYRTTGGSSPTLTLPLVVVDRTGPVVDTVAVEKNTTESKYPVEGNPDRTNPLLEGEVHIVVESTYYRAWGSFFEERTGGTVTYDHTADEVTISLVIPSNNPPLTRAVTSAAGGEDLELGNNAQVDAYNSSQGPYSPNSNGTIYIAGDVELKNDAQVSGSVHTQGTVDLSNPQTEIDGDVICSNGNDCIGDDKGEITGSVFTNGTDITVDPVDGAIEDKIDSIEDDNDNGDEVHIDGNAFNCSGTCDIKGGKYYLTGIELADEEVTFDTADGGDITLAVDGDIEVQGQDDKVEFDVDGPGTVRIYTNGDTIEITDHTKIETDENQTASKFWIYGRPGAEFELKNHVNMTGVIYAPNNAAEVGEITLETQSEIFGGAVGYVEEIDTNSGIHFDESLAEKNPLPDGGNAPITFLHVSVNHVNASSP